MVLVVVPSRLRRKTKQYFWALLMQHKSLIRFGVLQKHSLLAMTTINICADDVTLFHAESKEGNLIDNNDISKFNLIQEQVAYCAVILSCQLRVALAQHLQQSKIGHQLSLMYHCQARRNPDRRFRSDPSVLSSRFRLEVSATCLHMYPVIGHL